MQDFEKLGAFYLGRGYDSERKAGTDELVLYDSKDLVTHAVCIGMTGSGKTGLCISLLEEALIDGIPALIVDPKGDLANLLLTFPELRPADFEPWINADDARKKGVSAAEWAAQVAESWSQGLADWGQDGARIGRLRAAAEFAVYTPGSTAGTPLAVLKSFAPPPPAVADDADLFRERVSTTTTSLLALLGIDADPLRSREHILISKIFETAWRAGRELDLAALINEVQKPAFVKVGAFELETFYPQGERFELAMQLNNLLASPGFEAWTEGEPLDISRLLYTATGKPRAAVLSIAHLGDAERMFFVSLLLNELVGWMRTQPGTPSLRAVFYMDEIFGYLPPTANPPSKLPMLTLLKQARAFGLGMVLSTQNPVDLDYKALSNAGTWFIGRLQTDRDKQRVLEGLEGSAAGSFDRDRMQRILAGLGSRIFLLHNVHDDGPRVFQARWAMSYLCGPLTREQIKRLPQPSAEGAAPTASTAARPAAATTRASAGARVILPPEIQQTFVPVRGRAGTDEELVYRPALLVASVVHLEEPKLAVSVTRDKLSAIPLSDGAATVAWDATFDLDIPKDELEDTPTTAAFEPLPPAATKADSYGRWGRECAQVLYRTEQLELWQSRQLRQVSQVGESERDFRIRLLDAARAARDRAKEALRAKYAPKIRQIEERLRRGEQAIEREQGQVQQQGLQTALSVGATLVGALFGRKTFSASTIARATTAARSVGRVAKEREDVGRAEENVAATRQQLADLDAQLQQELTALDTSLDPAAEVFERVVVRPRKADISVRLATLGWLPYWRAPGGDGRPAWI